MKKQIKTNYKIGGIILLIMMLAIMVPTKSKAKLQSRPGVSSLTDIGASRFFLLCRQMETSEGPLGLNATITIENDKVIETTPSNGIDVHMIKNTEYGAAAMLSASVYGNCPTGYQNLTIDSTTGNDSGIMQMAGGQWEYVAGINKTVNSSYESYIKYIINADAKYKDEYENETTSGDITKAGSLYKPGDATYETPSWKGASRGNFIISTRPVFVRGYEGVFGLSMSTGDTQNGFSSVRTGTRATLVCGTKL